MSKDKEESALVGILAREELVDMFCGEDYIAWLCSPIQKGPEGDAPKAPPKALELPPLPPPSDSKG